MSNIPLYKPHCTSPGICRWAFGLFPPFGLLCTVLLNAIVLILESLLSVPIATLHYVIILCLTLECPGGTPFPWFSHTCIFGSWFSLLVLLSRKAGAHHITCANPFWVSSWAEDKILLPFLMTRQPCSSLGITSQVFTFLSFPVTSRVLHCMAAAPEGPLPLASPNSKPSSGNTQLFCLSPLFFIWINITAPILLYFSIM